MSTWKVMRFVLLLFTMCSFVVGVTQRAQGVPGLMVQYACAREREDFEVEDCGAFTPFSLDGNAGSEDEEDRNALPRSWSLVDDRLEDGISCFVAPGVFSFVKNIGQEESGRVVSCDEEDCEEEFCLFTVDLGLSLSGCFCNRQFWGGGDESRSRHLDVYVTGGGLTFGKEVFSSARCLAGCRGFWYIQSCFGYYVLAQGLDEEECLCVVDLGWRLRRRFCSKFYWGKAVVRFGGFSVEFDKREERTPGWCGGSSVCRLGFDLLGAFGCKGGPGICAGAHGHGELEAFCMYEFRCLYYKGTWGCPIRYHLCNRSFLPFLPKTRALVHRGREEEDGCDGCCMRESCGLKFRGLSVSKLKMRPKMVMRSLRMGASALLVIACNVNNRCFCCTSLCCLSMYLIWQLWDCILQGTFENLGWLPWLFLFSLRYVVATTKSSMRLRLQFIWQANLVGGVRVRWKRCRRRRGTVLISSKREKRQCFSFMKGALIEYLGNNRWWRAFVNSRVWELMGRRVGEAKRPGPVSFFISSVNVNNLDKHAHEWCSLDSDLLVAQEAKVVRTNVVGITKKITDRGYTPVYGKFLPIKRRQRGTCRDLVGTMKGGVAMAVRKGMAVHELKIPLSGEFDTRAMAMDVFTGSGWIRIVNLYGFSGANDQHGYAATLNEEFLKEVFLFAKARGDVPTFIFGDFNVVVEKSPTCRAFSQNGWADLGEVFLKTAPTMFFTAKSFDEGVGNRIDRIYANEQALACVKELKKGNKRWTGGHRHLVVELDMPVFNCQTLCFSSPRPYLLEGMEMGKKSIVKRTSLGVKAVAKRNKVTTTAINEGRMIEAWGHLNDIMDDCLASLDVQEGNSKKGQPKNLGSHLAHKWLINPEALKVKPPREEDFDMIVIGKFLRRGYTLMCRLENASEQPEKEEFIVESRKLWGKMRANQIAVFCKKDPPPQHWFSKELPPVERLRNIVEAAEKRWKLKQEQLRNRRWCKAREALEEDSTEKLIWKLIKSRPKPYPVYRMKDGGLSGNPCKVLEEAVEFWTPIFRDQTQFSWDTYSQQFSKEMQMLTSEEVGLKLTADDFLLGAKEITNSSSGIDGMSVREMKATTFSIMSIMARFWNKAAAMPKMEWHSSLLKAKAVLIPKPDAEGPQPIDKMRPITVLPVAFRLWSRVIYARLRPWLQKKLPAGLIGGRPRGEVSRIAFDLSLTIVESVSKLVKQTAFIVTTDFSKFFDTLKWEHIFGVARIMGIPLGVIRIYQSILPQLQRFLCVNGAVWETPLLALNGVVQGDALSMVWAAVGLATWSMCMNVQCRGVRTLAYVDDRYLLCRKIKELQKALDLTKLHDMLAGFKLNPDKTGAMASTASGRRALSKVHIDGHKVKVSHYFKAVGHMISSIKRRNATLATKRIKVAKGTLKKKRKVGMLNIPKRMIGIQGMVVPQAVYGAWLAPLPKYLAKSLGTDMLEAILSDHSKLRARELCISLLVKAHRFIPEVTSDYDAFMTESRVLRRNPDLETRYKAVVKYVLDNSRCYNGNYPACRVIQLCQDLEATINGDLVVSHPHFGTFNLVHDHPTLVGHKVRLMLRDRERRRLAWLKETAKVKEGT